MNPRPPQLQFDVESLAGNWREMAEDAVSPIVPGLLNA